MSPPRQDTNSQAIRSSSSGLACPACGGSVSADANWCPSCNFTGASTLELFPDPPPPLMPLLDAADIWKAADVRKIEAAREKLRRRFPQFHFHVCTVMLPEETSLPVFGFWLLNVCPFYVNETAEDRSWTILLLINARTGKCAVIPGYSAEPWISDDNWSKVISLMATPWKAGKTVDAVIRYFETAGLALDHVWKTRGLRRSKRSRS